MAAGEWNPNWGPQFGSLPLPGGGSTGTLDEWLATLDEVPQRVADGAEQVVSRGAWNIKTQARETVSGRAHLPHYPASIGYDLSREQWSVAAEIGPDKELPQGPLGNIIEYGSVNNAPIPHLNPALDDEEPRFRAACADLGESAFS